MIQLAGIGTVARVGPVLAMFVVGVSQLRARRAAARARQQPAPAADSADAPELEPTAPLIRLRPGELRRYLGDGGDLDSVDLRNADLAGIDLSGRDLSGLDLTGARLRRANLSYAILHGCNLHFTELNGALLSGADLTMASLVEAELTGADLCGADLGGVRNLTTAILRRARFDAETRWPTGFDPLLAGAVRGPGPKRAR